MDPIKATGNFVEDITAVRSRIDFINGGLEEMATAFAIAGNPHVAAGVMIYVRALENIGSLLKEIRDNRINEDLEAAQQSHQAVTDLVFNTLTNRAIKL